MEMHFCAISAPISLGGVLSASGKMEAIDDNSHSSFQARLQKISLAEVRETFASTGAAKDIALSGQANATATAEWGNTLDDLVAHAELSVDGQANRSPPVAQKKATTADAGDNPGNEAVVPIHGEFHTIYSNGNHELTFNDSCSQELAIQSIAQWHGQQELEPRRESTG